MGGRQLCWTSLLVLPSTLHPYRPAQCPVSWPLQTVSELLDLRLVPGLGWQEALEGFWMVVFIPLIPFLLAHCACLLPQSKASAPVKGLLLPQNTLPALLGSLNSSHSFGSSLLLKSPWMTEYECSVLSLQDWVDATIRWEVFLSDVSRWMNNDIGACGFLSLTFSSFECLNVFLPCARVRHHFIHSGEMVVGHQTVLGISSHIDDLKLSNEENKRQRETRQKHIFIQYEGPGP